MSGLINALTRRKRLDGNDESQLARVLTVFDLTALGVGATLGAGVYVLTGAVAKDTSGPSVVISFLIAALTSILSGLCYAEFGARVPKAGSGYVYSYVTVGECCAFVIGWNLILSYVIGAASVARAWTANFDALINKTIERHMMDCCHMNVSFLAPYPDLFSFLIILILTALIAFGVKEFATVNKIFTVLNIGVILFVVIAGLTQADLHNWAWTPLEIIEYLENGTAPDHTADVLTNITNVVSVNVSTLADAAAAVTSNVSDAMGYSDVTTGGTALEVDPMTYPFGQGGFLPYGFAGLVSGTATCFYAFVGFDCIATTGEEAINPQRSIPLGIVFSLAVCCVAYLSISCTLTLMQPYFLLDEDAPLPYAFDYVGLGWARYPVSVGAICALSTSLLGAMFPMPRIIYAMAVDGLLFKFLAEVHSYTKTPLIATFVSGVLAGIMATFFNLKELVDLMSIGTLAAYTLVAASVLLLRYQPDPEADVIVTNQDEMMDDEKNMISNELNARKDDFHHKLLFQPQSTLPTQMTSSITSWTTSVIAFAMTLFSVIAVLASSSGWNAAFIIFEILLGIIVVLGTFCIWMQPPSTKELSFEVPLVPLVPILNMFVNIYLMVSLPPSTWYKMLIWLLIGALIYFFYGVGHSLEGKNANEIELSVRKQENKSSGQDQQLLGAHDSEVRV